MDWMDHFCGLRSYIAAGKTVLLDDIRKGMRGFDAILEWSFLVSLSYYEYCDKELDDLSVGY